MLIDWFTVIAQILNFLILIWLLKRFLYKPVLSAIDERDKRITAQLETAEELKKQATAERETFEQKNAEMDQKREALSREIEAEAQHDKQRLLEAARKEYESLRAKNNETLKNEQAALSREVSRRIQEEVLAITRKALADLASSSLEKRITEVFIEKLKAMEAKDRERISAAASVLVRSAIELSSDQRISIENALKTPGRNQIQIHFETVPDLISGIEVILDGNKIAWSIRDYLTSFEKRLSEVPGNV